MKANMRFLIVFFFLFLLPGFLFNQGESKTMQPFNINLPDTVDGWKLEGPPRRIDRSNIFDYMDGAGELYLGYHFGHLLVFQYRDKDDNEILVELYHMKDSQDAFGLLSLDWGGESVMLDRPTEREDRNPVVPFSRALYGMGLLRVWSDDLYVRIMAFRETPGVREVILQLGKIITAERKNPAPPDLLGIVGPETNSGWILKKDRTAYFFSHLVLNSLYYLSHENILSLNQDTEALMTVYEKNLDKNTRNRIYLLVIKYPDSNQAISALDGFINAYLPELKSQTDPGQKMENQDFFQVEDGWLGYQLLKHYLVLAIGCPDLESAQEVLKQVNFE
jgi:hypothetical protein